MSGQDNGDKHQWWDNPGNRQRRGSDPVWYIGDRFEPWFERHFHHRWTQRIAKMVAITAVILGGSLLVHSLIGVAFRVLS